MMLLVWISRLLATIAISVGLLRRWRTVCGVGSGRKVYAFIIFISFSAWVRRAGVVLNERVKPMLENVTAI